MNTPMLLRVNREGSFEVTAEQCTDNNCGSLERKNFRYEVMIEATNENLTPEGFVMENQWIDDWFRDTYEVKKLPCESCEIMAQKAVNHFLDMFNDASLPTSAVKVTKIVVRVHGASISFIEAEWKRI